MAEPTPGPWEILAHSEGDEVLNVIAGPPVYDGSWVCAKWVAELDGDSLDGEPGENEANARLIAAAPDLLAACEAAKETMEMQEKREREDFHIPEHTAKAIWEETIGQLEEAIAKAKGADA